MLKRYAYKFEINPKSGQVEKMKQFAGCVRFVWNKALTIQRERLNNKEKILTYFDMTKLLTEWRKEYKFLKDGHSQTQDAILKNLSFAFKDVLKKNSTKGFPKFKKKGRKDSFTYRQSYKLDQVNNRVYLPKIGWVKYRNSRTVEGNIKNITVSKHLDKWFISIQVEQEIIKPRHPSKSAIGIDVGVNNFATCSNGLIVEPMNSFKKYEKRLRFLQRGLSRKQKFSSNWRKHKGKIAKLYSKITNVRNNFLHQNTNKLSNNHALVILENLKISNMSRSASGCIDNPGKNVKAKTGLNRSILDQGWYEFRRQLAYKLKWKGGELKLIDPKYTSQKCSICGYIHPDNRFTQSKFICKKCGYSENADINAAKNILAAGYAVIACGGYGASQPMKQEPVEREQALKACS